jgi:hypothetical protein
MVFRAPCTAVPGHPGTSWLLIGHLLDTDLASDSMQLTLLMFLCGWLGYVPPWMGSKTKAVTAAIGVCIDCEPPKD